MRSAGVSTLLGALVLAAGLLGSAARAAEAADVIHARLAVQALPDCTTREEVVARVAARSRRIEFDDGAAGPTLRIVVAPGPHGRAVGELEMSEANGKIWSRRLSAPSCAEAADALALIIALTLDPTAPSARTTPPAPTKRPPERGAGPAAPGPPPPATPPPVREPKRSGLSPRSPPADRPPPAVAAPETQAPVAEPRVDAGVAAEVLVGLSPNALPGVSVSVLAALDREALWSPALVLGGTHAWSSGLVEPGGTAAFTVDALSLDACPLRARLSALEARACASALLGRIRAEGSETYAPASASRPYAAAGGALRLSLALGRFVDLTARIDAAASLIRDSFAFNPTVFHRTAATILVGELGVALRIP